MFSNYNNNQAWVAVYYCNNIKYNNNQQKRYLSLGSKKAWHQKIKEGPQVHYIILQEWVTFIRLVVTDCNLNEI